MKKILKLTFFFLFAVTYSQNISDYTFVHISEKSMDFEGNKYGLTDLLHSKLSAKKYTVINGDTENWPAEAKNNPCGVLKAELVDSSSFLKNKLQINFKDCNEKMIGTFEGKSNIKEYAPGFKEALQLALKTLPTSNPVQPKTAVGQKTGITEQPTPKTSITVTESFKTKEVPVQKKTEVKTENKAEIFSNGSVLVNRIFISDSQFILANPNNSTPYAIFKSSTKKDVYRVQLQDGTQTLGYLEDSKIVVELPNPDGSFRKEEFLRK